MKFITRYAPLFILPLLVLCGAAPGAIPSGQWEYRLLANGVQVGRAILSNRASNGNYVITSELRMDMGRIGNISRQIVTETTDFRPVKLESYTTLLNNGKKQTIDTVAEFNGQTVTVRAGDKTSAITLRGNFVLDGNYFIASMIGAGFRRGFETKALIYDPTIELETLIPVTTRVIGMEDVVLGGKTVRLMHITQSIDNVKSADSYLDEKGVLVRAVIQMMNITIELVRE